MKVDFLTQFLAFLLALIFLPITAAIGQENGLETPALTIGSVAPALDIEHWVQDGAGAFKPVQKFEKGKLYVVEFWATWCGPCIQSMPHLSQLQKKYQDKGLQIISISDEDLETVEAFLKRKVPPSGDDSETEQTYDELTQNYCLTTDPDRSANSDYMQAAGQNGIPCAFLVGKSGRIEWIGHPMGMDEPLEAVIEGTWDAEKFGVAFKQEQELNLQKARVIKLLRSAPPKEQIGIINDELQKAEGEFRTQLKQYKFNLLMSLGETDKLAPIVADIMSNLKATEEINNFAWATFQAAQRGRIKDLSLFDSIVAAAELAGKKAEGRSKAMILDTLAHIHHLRGDLKQAISVQRDAVAAGADDLPEIQAFLKELESEL